MTKKILLQTFVVTLVCIAMLSLPSLASAQDPPDTSDLNWLSPTFNLPFEVSSVTGVLEKLNRRGQWAEEELARMGIKVTSSFEGRLHPDLGIWRPHWGLDLAANKDTPVYTTARGWVVRVSSVSEGSDERLVVVQHYDGTISRYLHLSKENIVKEGQYVPAGYVIGKVYKDHLHYEEGWVDNFEIQGQDRYRKDNLVRVGPTRWRETLVPSESTIDEYVTQLQLETGFFTDSQAKQSYKQFLAELQPPSWPLKYQLWSTLDTRDMEETRLKSEQLFRAKPLQLLGSDPLRGSLLDDYLERVALKGYRQLVSEGKWPRDDFQRYKLEQFLADPLLRPPTVRPMWNDNDTLDLSQFLAESQQRFEFLQQGTSDKLSLEDYTRYVSGQDFQDFQDFQSKWRTLLDSQGEMSKWQDSPLNLDISQDELNLLTSPDSFLNRELTSIDFDQHLSKSEFNLEQLKSDWEPLNLTHQGPLDLDFKKKQPTIDFDQELLDSKLKVPQQPEGFQWEPLNIPNQGPLDLDFKQERPTINFDQELLDSKLKVPQPPEGFPWKGTDLKPGTTIPWKVPPPPQGFQWKSP